MFDRGTGPGTPHPATRATLALVTIALVLAGCLSLSPDSTPIVTEGDLTPMNRSIEGLFSAQESQIVDLEDGGSFTLTAEPVQHDPGTGSIRMMAYNGQIPGPTLRAPQGATITVDFENRLDVATTVHWHGIRLDNAEDGVPGITQDPIPPGGSFTYTVTLPDAGAFWYHTHLDGDRQQEMGLYGALIVDPPRDDEDAWPPEHVIHLDDLLVEEGDLPHVYEDAATYAVDGRWSNQLFVDGDNDPARIEVLPQERHRLHLLNTANARTWWLSFDGFDTVEKIATGASYLEEPRSLDALTLGPGERAIVDVVLAVDQDARIVDEAMQAPVATITPEGTPDPEALLTRLEAPPGPHEQARAEDRASILAGTPDRAIAWDLILNQPHQDDHDHGHDHHQGQTGYPQPDNMDPFPTDHDVDWLIRDVDTGRTQPSYTLQEGDVVDITIRHEHQEDADHEPVPHPMHVHGQRFLVKAYGDQPASEVAWKDTVNPNDPVAGYNEVTIRVVFDNPGTWLFHCHVNGHSESGMTGIFEVEPAP